MLTKPKPIQKTSIVLKSSTVPDLPKDRQAKMRSDKAPVDKAPVKTTSNVDKEGGEEKKPKVRFNAMPVETTCRDGLCNVKNNAGILCPNQVDQGAATAITRARCFPHNVQINKLSGPRYVKRNAEVNWAKMFNMNATIEPFHPDEEGEEGEEEEEGPRVIDMNSLARSRLLNSVKKIFSPTSQQAATTLTMLKTNNP